MTAMPGCRITGAVLGARAPMADEGGLLSAHVWPHPYLSCACGEDLWQGVNEHGAEFYACVACKRISDTRRVA